MRSAILILYIIICGDIAYSNISLKNLVTQDEYLGKQKQAIEIADVIEKVAKVMMTLVVIGSLGGASINLSRGNITASATFFASAVIIAVASEIALKIIN